MANNLIYKVIKKNKLAITKFANYTDEIAKIIAYKKNLPGKLIVVTSMSPNPSGEGKTTTLIGLVDGLNKLHKKCIGVLREPSLGPVFGMKGTATGSNKSSLIPADKINLHFTGDMHAITTANNLISAIIENEIYQNSPLNIDPKKIVWKRCIDINDRGLRHVSLLDINKNHDVINTSFNITAASDLMALFCLSNTIEEFRDKLNESVVAFTYEDQPIKIKDLQIIDALMTILSDAFYPNLVQTLENNPIIIHGGPFANIATGCSSLFGIKTGLSLSDITVTEAGFGSELGLEKFMNIAAQQGGLKPNLILLVISLKSVLYYGKGVSNDVYKQIDLGYKNVKHHLNHCRKYKIPVVIAINHRVEDNPEQLNYLIKLLKEDKVNFEINDSWSLGSLGTKNLARLVLKEIDNDLKYEPLYQKNDEIVQKITKIALNAYGSDDIVIDQNVIDKLNAFKKDNDWKNYSICIAKSPYLINGNENNESKIYIKNVEINWAAKLIIPFISTIYKMPGLPKNPIAKNFKFK